MKAHIETLDAPKWIIKEPSWEWEDINGFKHKGAEPPEGNVRHVYRSLGKSFVSISAEFVVSGDPTGKEKVFAEKLWQLMSEFKLEVQYTCIKECSVIEL